MVAKLLAAFLLMAACVVLHATGLTLAMRWMERSLPAIGRSYGRQLRLLIAVAGWTVLVHLAEITVWAVYLAARGGMPDLDSALYFSAVTYTTTGYGDLVLPEPWRLVGGVEALTGILMCGWSTGFFFAIVNQIFLRDAKIAGATPAEGGS
jgi:voltage-gated potassium channel Kch